MNYKIVNYTADIAAPSVLFADVLETTTNHIICSKLPQKEAKSVCRNLNFGGGFDGWTPAFFLEKFDFSKLESEELV